MGVVSPLDACKNASIIMGLSLVGFPVNHAPSSYDDSLIAVCAHSGLPLYQLCWLLGR